MFGSIHMCCLTHWSSYEFSKRKGLSHKVELCSVDALYPSIRWVRGIAALRWFIDHHTRFSQTLKDLCLKLAHFVLTNRYVECKELGGALFQQVLRTAIGTSFSVMYAIIFMIWLETPIVDSERF